MARIAPSAQIRYRGEGAWGRGARVRRSKSPARCRVRTPQSHHPPASQSGNICWPLAARSMPRPAGPGALPLRRLSSLRRLICPRSGLSPSLREFAAERRFQASASEPSFCVCGGVVCWTGLLRGVRAVWRPVDADRAAGLLDVLLDDAHGDAEVRWRS